MVALAFLAKAAAIGVRRHGFEPGVQYRRKLSTLRATEEQKYAEKDRPLAVLAAKAKVAIGRSLVASA